MKNETVLGAFLSILLILGCASQNVQNADRSSGSLPARSIAAASDNTPCLAQGAAAIQLEAGESILPPPATKRMIYDGDVEKQLIRYYFAVADQTGKSSFGYVVKMNSLDCSLKSPPVEAMPID